MGDVLHQDHIKAQSLHDESSLSEVSRGNVLLVLARRSVRLDSELGVEQVLVLITVEIGDVFDEELHVQTQEAKLGEEASCSGLGLQGVSAGFTVVVDCDGIDGRVSGVGREAGFKIGLLLRVEVIGEVHLDDCLD